MIIEIYYKIYREREKNIYFITNLNFFCNKTDKLVESD